MQVPETPPPPLAPLWDRVVRARALPPDLDVDLLYVAIRDRLTHPEREVRLHALRVLADLLPLVQSALSFPFDQVVDNLGHASPNVRKAALDALKVFCTHCEDAECAARALLDKCYYHNIRPHSAGLDTKMNVITGLILSIPSVMGILKRRNPALDLFPVFQILGEKLFDPIHRDVAHRALMKLRKVCGSRDYASNMSRLDYKIQEKFQVLCDNYDEDSHDVFYAPKKTVYRENNNQPVVKINQVFNNSLATPIRVTTDSSSEDSFARIGPYYSNNFAKVIIETEIKFDSDTAITMTVLEENDIESEQNTTSDDEYDSSDRNMLRYSDDGDSEDTDVIVKKVRFGGESVKIRTPDSDNLLTSEEDVKQNKKIDQNVPIETDNIEQISRPVTPEIVNKMNEIKREALERETQMKPPKKSGIPLPVLQNKSHKQEYVAQYNRVKLKSKSLSELYDYFRSKNDGKSDTKDSRKAKEFSGFALTISEVRSPEKARSPVEPHREVEVLHNLQRSPVVSPRRAHTRVHLDQDGFVLSLLASSPPPREDLVSPRAPTPLQPRYDWEDLDIVPTHVVEQLHNTENWIAAVKAADQLHSALLDSGTVRRVEPAALSLVKHMWALSDAVSAAKAPAEGAVCALVRAASSDCARQLLPALVSRMAREPLPAALPHALLQRLALHHLIDLIFDPHMLGVWGDSERVQAAQLRAALCAARAAGPAAVLAAVRRRLAGTARADSFCNELRERLSRPVENIKPSYVGRSSQLPVPVRRRARSTPPPAGPQPPRRLRPLPDSAPLPGNTQAGREYLLKPLSPIPLSDRDLSAPPVRDHDDDSKEPIEHDDKSYNDTIPNGHADIFGDEVSADVPTSEIEPSPRPSRSPSIRIEDFSEKSNPSLSLSGSGDVGASPTRSHAEGTEGPASLKSSNSRVSAAERRSPSGKSATPPAGSGRASPALGARSPEPPVGETARGSRDVRTALAECILPPRHEDWEAIEAGLVETERLAEDAAARAPAASWRAAARNATTHVRSLRSRVARAACRALGALFSSRGRALEPELEEGAAALLDRCADVNRFLRADASAALARLASASGAEARAAVALCRRGATHRAGPVRAAAAAALARLVSRAGASRVLSLPPEPRALLLRTSGELLADASAETRAHARHLALALAEDARFRPLLKDAMPISRYRNVEKLLDKLRYQ